VLGEILIPSLNHRVRRENPNKTRGFLGQNLKIPADNNVCNINVSQFREGTHCIMVYVKVMAELSCKILHFFLFSSTFC